MYTIQTMNEYHLWETPVPYHHIGNMCL